MQSDRLARRQQLASPIKPQKVKKPPIDDYVTEQAILIGRVFTIRRRALREMVEHRPHMSKHARAALLDALRKVKEEATQLIDAFEAPHTPARSPQEPEQAASGIPPQPGASRRPPAGPGAEPRQGRDGRARRHPKNMLG
ncbi:hypothetical protein SAMN05444161_3109 [Rhizobiales bacterium GAS191]|nr:hypothetical protein SAMN05444161_3109 [Rhizobiales bacterium GAS191]